MIDVRTLINALRKILLVNTHSVLVLFKNSSHGLRDSENLSLIL